MIAFLFWLVFCLVVYAYAGYPLALLIVSKLRADPVKKKYIYPKVSVILSAFNEEKNIERKIKNLLSMSYPEDRLEVLIGSDGASDQTDQIVSKHTGERIRFFKFVKNLGKPSVINALVREAKGSIIIFTDVRQDFDVEAIKALVSNFNDERVGCVSGELYFKAASPDHEGAVAKGMGAYWAYEKFLRKSESLIGSMLGATGAIYAIRRKLFKPLPDNILVDDMYIPLSIVSQGYRAVFDSEAKAYDAPSVEGAQEFKRKVRTLVGNYQIFISFPHLLDVRKSKVAIQMISHKVFRVMVPFLLIALFLINLLLILKPFYLGFLVAQMFFYGMACVEAVQPTKKKEGVAYLPYMFCLLNYSAFIAFFRFLKGNYKAAWDKAYD